MISLRTWPALAAWGAGLVHAATAAGAPWGVLLLLCAAGLAEFAWGVATLRAGRLARPRAALLGAVGILLGSAIATLAGGMGLAPFGASAVLLLWIVAAAGARMRRPGGAHDAPGPARAALGLVIGAVLVAGLTTPALAMTEPGEHAVPHGETPGTHGH